MCKAMCPFGLPCCVWWDSRGRWGCVEGGEGVGLTMGLGGEGGVGSAGLGLRGGERGWRGSRRRHLLHLVVLCQV